MKNVTGKTVKTKITSLERFEKSSEFLSNHFKHYLTTWKQFRTIPRKLPVIIVIFIFYCGENLKVGSIEKSIQGFKEENIRNFRSFFQTLFRNLGSTFLRVLSVSKPLTSHYPLDSSSLAHNVHWQISPYCLDPSSAVSTVASFIILMIQSKMNKKRNENGKKITILSVNFLTKLTNIVIFVCFCACNNRKIFLQNETNRRNESEYKPGIYIKIITFSQQ